MLMYGRDTDEVLALQFAGQGVVYNLTSLREGFNNLRLLLPPREVGRCVDRDFDIQYYQYILNNDYVFCEFFQIVYNLYLGIDVFIIASEEDWSENILESLLKIIQQRYGYNSVKIDTDEDYIFARNSMDFRFSPPGLYNLDQDKDRFAAIVEKYRLSHNGSMPLMLKWNDEEQ